MSFSYREVLTNEEDREAYIALHNDLFKSANIDRDWMDWYHVRLPSVRKSINKTRTFGVLDGNRLIGIWSVEEIILSDTNKSYRVGRCFAVGIHSDYRRQGLFVSLSTYALGELKKSKEFEFLVGFPQKGRSVTGGHLKAGWELFGEIQLMSKKIETYPHIGVNIGNVNNSLERVTSDSYLKARFLEHPYCNYSYFSYGDGLVILKGYADFVQIVYSHGNPKELEMLNLAMQRLAYRHGQKEILTWSNPLSLEHSNISKLGFATGSDNNVSVDIIHYPITINTPSSILGLNFYMSIEEGY